MATTTRLTPLTACSVVLAFAIFSILPATAGATIAKETLARASLTPDFLQQESTSMALFNDSNFTAEVVNAAVAWNTRTIKVIDTATRDVVPHTRNGDTGEITFNAKPRREYRITDGSILTPPAGQFSDFEDPNTANYFDVPASSIVLGEPIHLYRRDYINDHSVIYNENDGKWHMYGLFDNNTELLHLTSETLTDPSSWVRKTGQFQGTDANGNFLGRPGGTWAPHIVENNNTFHMFYTSVVGGSPREITLSTSTDLFNWPNLAGVLNAGDNGIGDQKNKDPMVLRDEPNNRWIMYVGMLKAGTNDKWVVGYSISTDLAAWSIPQPCFDEDTTSPGVESPFVVRRGSSYYLFLSARPWGPHADGTEIFKSNDPTSWTTNQKVKRIFPWHAAEVVRDLDGKWFLTNCGLGRDGLWIAELTWGDGEDENDTSMPVPAPAGE